MGQDLFNVFFDVFFGAKIFTFGVNIFSKNKQYKKFRVIGFILSAIFLLSIHIGYFISKKESNFFELINIPRVFELQDLKDRVILLKKQKQTTFLNNTVKLSQINEILSNTPLKNSYDKFNKRKFDKKEEMMSIVQRFQMILYQKVFENSIYYIILTVIIVITSDDENSRKSRKWVIATMVAFYFMELNYIFLNNNEKDFIDYILPFMSIFERIQLARDLLMPIMFIIKFRYQFFFKDELYIVRRQMNKNIPCQRSIKGAFENSWGKEEVLEKIQKNIESGYEILTEHLRKKEMQKKKDIKQEVNKNEKKTSNSNKILPPSKNNLIFL